VYYCDKRDCGADCRSEDFGTTGEIKKEEKMSEQKNILIIKLGALGDFILQLGWVFALYEKYPDANFTFMTTKPFVPFVKAMPFISDIIVDTRPRGDIKQWWRTCKNGIADTKWDYIFDLQASNRTRNKYFNVARFFTSYNMNWAHLSKEGFLVRSMTKKRAFSFGKMETYHMPFVPKDVD
jgi:ADP-heptose:LPS heptosyltransferase